MLLLALMLSGMVGAVPQGGGAGQNTMLRFGCSQVVVDRIDPLVNPGLAPSPHMHQVRSLIRHEEYSKLGTLLTQF